MIGCTIKAHPTRLSRVKG